MSVPAYPSYYDSGIAWLGPIPAGWSIKPVRAVATCNDDVLDESTPPDFPIEYIEISDVDPFVGITGRAELVFSGAPSRARRRVQDGDVIVSTVRTYLRAIAPIVSANPSTVVSTGFAVMRPCAIDAGYLAYLFRAEFLISEIIARSVGVSYPAINASEITHLKVPVPPPAEQSAIAAFLDRETGKIDALVAEQERLIALLKEKRQAVISQAVTKGLDPNAPMKDSGVEWLGEVPAHWEVEPLKRFLREPLMYGANQASDDDTPGNPRFVRITDVADDGSLRDDTFRSLPPAVAEPYLLVDGDILLARSGATVGKSFKYRDSWGICCFAGYLIRARFDMQRLTADFADYLCASKLYWACVQAEQIQATIPNVSAERYGAMLLPCPPTDEQARICNYLNGVTAKIDTLTTEAHGAIALLKERRTALISAAVTGKIDVRGLVPEVQEAA